MCQGETGISPERHGLQPQESGVDDGVVCP
jgi:hypothetical protein